jgi:FkbM family methyltransferase
MSFLSYAQNFEDVLLWRALSHVQDGFYVDIGAQDPVIDSVSLAFYERGWHGVNVEPVPHYAQMLREQRPRDILVAGAVSDRADMLRFFEIPGTGISTANKEIADSHRIRGHEPREIVVPCVTLATIFEFVDTAEVHWLKIDVEGHEQQVLTGWGTASARPWIVVVESTLPLTQIESYEDWEPLLLAKDYRFAHFDGLNRYYVSGAHLELCDVLKCPPNVFDDFELNGTANAPFHKRLVARAQIEIDRIEKQSASVRRDLAVVTQRAEDLTLKHQAAVDRHQAERGQWLAEQHVLMTRAAESLEQLRLLSEDAIQKERDLTHKLLTLQDRVAQDSAAMQRKYTACVEQFTALMDKQMSVASEQSTAHALELGQLRRERELLVRESARDKARQQASFEGRLHEYRQRVFGLQTLNADITNSVSWRITAPIRVFSRKNYVAIDEAFDIAPSKSDDLIRDDKELEPAKNLRQLMLMSDREFVHSAYATILGRPPDVGGAQHYASRLQSGEARAAILRDLYRSDEARRAKVHIPWLGRAVFRYRVLCILIPGFRKLRFSRTVSPVQMVMQRVERLERRIHKLTEGAMETQIESSDAEPHRAEALAEKHKQAVADIPIVGLTDKESIVARRIFRELVEAAQSPRADS